jgi:2-isopropylmalate synthase
VDATLNALIKAVSLDDPVSLELYQVAAITGGTDARVNVEVMLRHGERVLSSRGVDEDIVLASVKAYLNGVNLFQNMKKEK